MPILPRSALKTAIESLPEDFKMKSAGVRNYLKKKGVKDEELKWSGMDEELEAVKDEPTLTKKDLSLFERARVDVHDIKDVGTSYIGTSIDGSDYNEKVRTFKQLGEQRRVSSHYGEKTGDYLQHSRSTRGTIDGKKTRLVQELQSDLHQRGRRQGYAKIDEWKTELQELKEVAAELEKDNAEFSTNILRKYKSRISELENAIASPNTPKSPYEETWLKKGMEQEILNALEEGDDAIAIPLEGYGNDLARGEGVQKWYETKVRDTMKKLAKSIPGAKYKETVENSNLTMDIPELTDILDGNDELYIDVMNRMNITDPSLEEAAEYVLANPDMFKDIVGTSAKRSKKMGQIVFPEREMTTVPFTRVEIKNYLRGKPELRMKYEQLYTEFTSEDKPRFIDLVDWVQENIEDQPGVLPEFTQQKTKMPEWAKKFELYSAGGATVTGTSMLGTEEAQAAEPKSFFDTMKDENITIDDMATVYSEDNSIDIESAKDTVYSSVADDVVNVMKEADVTPEDMENFLISEYNISRDDVYSIMHKTDVNNSLEPVATEPNLSDETTESLAVASRNVNSTYMPVLTGLKGWLFEDKKSSAEYEKGEKELNISIANTLRKLGRNVSISKDGELVETLEDGTVQEVDESILESIASSEKEIIGGIGGASLAFKAAGRAIPASGPLGVAAKIGVTGIGMALGTAGGRGLDVLSNAIKTKEEISVSKLKAQMQDAGAFAAVTEVVGVPILWMGKQGFKAIAKSYDLVVRGNKEGAYQSLKEFTNLNDDEVKELIKQWEDLTGNKAPGFTLSNKALHVLPKTLPGGEAIVRPAASMNLKTSATVAREIDQRAKDLVESSRKLTTENIGPVLHDELSRYTKDVKSFYTGIKKLGVDAMEESNYTFDYDKLALDPLLEQMHNKITNPAIKERFKNYIEAIKQIGAVKQEESLIILPSSVKKELAGPSNNLRSFESLIDLKRTLNQFKFDKRITQAVDFKAINSVINTLDTAITNAAKEHMDNPTLWLGEWKKANVEYGKMKVLEKNVLYKALTAKGANVKKIVRDMSNRITSIDGTFMEVLGKLPKSVRNNAEGAVLNTLIDKHTLGFESGFQAVHFPNLAKELEHVGFTTPESRSMKRAIKQMAEVFQNDIELSRATGQIAKPKFQSYLTTDPVVRAKYEIASSAFNYLKRLVPTDSGNAIALVSHVSKVLKTPTNSKAVEAMIKAMPNDPEMAAAIRQLAIQYAKFGQPENYPHVTVYRTGVPGSSHKTREGALGKGMYFTTDESVAKERAKATGGKLIKEDVLPSRIASEATVRDLLGVEELDKKVLKNNPALIDKLKERGYTGVSIKGTELMIFK